MSVRLVRGSAMAALVAAALISTSVISNGGSTPVAAQTTAAQATTAPASCPAPGGQGQFMMAARADGTITAISGATFTLTQQDNSTRTITTDPNTRYEKSVASSVGAIAVGDVVMVQGTTSGDTVAATAINDNGQPLQMSGAQNGQMPNGQGQSPFGPPMGMMNGGTPPALPAGCTPPQGMPQGMPQGGPPQGGQNMGNAPGGGFAFGTVQQVNGATLTLSTRDGKTTTVTTDANTTVTSRQQGSFADLQVGDHVTASAAPNSGADSNATAFTATMVSDRGAS